MFLDHSDIISCELFDLMFSDVCVTKFWIYVITGSQTGTTLNPVNFFFNTFSDWQPLKHEDLIGCLPILKHVLFLNFTLLKYLHDMMYWFANLDNIYLYK